MNTAASIFFSTAMMLAVCSCAAPEDLRLQKAAQQAEADVGACTRGELTPENALQRRDCADDSIVVDLNAGGYSHMDWVYQVIDSNRAAAIAYAQGHISKDAYISVVRENNEQFNAENNQLNENSSAINPNWVHDWAVMQEQQYQQEQPLFPPQQHCDSYSIGDHVYTTCQ